MAQIAPDIPELQDVPEIARPMVWMGVLAAAIRAPGTLIPGLTLFLLAVVLGGAQGDRLFGLVGLMGGAALGAAASIHVFYTVLLPWRARQLLPEFLKQVDLTRFDHVQRADDAVSRMVAAYKERELSSSIKDGERSA